MKRRCTAEGDDRGGGDGDGINNNGDDK